MNDWIEAREAAIREVIRVLRPDGRLIIVDIQRYARQYVRVYYHPGLEVNTCKKGGWRLWWSGHGCQQPYLLLLNYRIIRIARIAQLEWVVMQTQ